MNDCRTGDKFDIHSMDPSGRVGIRETSEFLTMVLNDPTLKDRIAMAEKMNGKQTMATAMLWGRNDGGNNVAQENEINHSEKILKEKRRMLGL